MAPGRAQSLACFYLPDFPAWAFARSGRSVRPIAVVASGRVIAANRLARRQGVEPGMTAERAATLAPATVVCPRDAGLERAAWEEVLRELHALTPFLEEAPFTDAGPNAPDAMGWAFLGGASAEALRTLAERYGARVGLVRSETAHQAASGGAGVRGAHRTLARLAALRAAPGRVLAVDLRHGDAFLARFPVGDLAGLGFGPDLLERLGLFGYPTLGAATSLTLRQLRAQFGREGERLHQLLHPGEAAPVAVFRPPPAVTVSVDLEEALREPGDLLPHLDRLVAGAAARLGEIHCRRLTVSLVARPIGRRRTDDASGSQPMGDTWRTLLATRVLPEATRSERTLATAARVLLLSLLSTETEVEAVAVELGGLGRPAVRQGGLFGEKPSVYGAVRAVHRRFPGAIKRAVLAVHALFDEDVARFEPFPEAAPVRRRRRRS